MLRKIQAISDQHKIQNLYDELSTNFANTKSKLIRAMESGDYASIKQVFTLLNKVFLLAEDTKNQDLLALIKDLYLDLTRSLIQTNILPRIPRNTMHRYNIQFFEQKIAEYLPSDQTYNTPFFLVLFEIATRTLQELSSKIDQFPTATCPIICYLLEQISELIMNNKQLFFENQECLNLYSRLSLSIAEKIKNILLHLNRQQDINEEFISILLKLTDVLFDLRKKIEDSKPIEPLYYKLYLERLKVSIALLGINTFQREYNHHQLSHLEAKIMLLAIKQRKMQANTSIDFNVLAFKNAKEFMEFLSEIRKNPKEFFEDQNSRKIIFIIGDQYSEHYDHWVSGEINLDASLNNVQCLLIDPLLPEQVEDQELYSNTKKIFEEIPKQFPNCQIYTNVFQTQHAPVGCDVFAFFYATQLYKYNRDNNGNSIFDYFNKQHSEKLNVSCGSTSMEYYPVELPYKTHELTQTKEILTQDFINKYEDEPQAATKKTKDYSTKLSKQLI